MSDGVRLLRRLRARDAGARSRTGRADIAEVWTPLGIVWADVRPRGGREDFVAGRPRPRVKYRVLVRGGAGRVGVAAAPGAAAARRGAGSSTS